jgi:hypothetical protein
MNHLCTRCGTKLTENALFCSECGAAIAAAFEEPEVFCETPPQESLSHAQEAFVSQETFAHELIEATEENNAHEQAAHKNTVTVPAFTDEVVTSPTAPMSVKAVLIAIASVLISVVLFAAITAGQSWFILKNGINNQTVSTMAKAAISELNLAEFPIFDYVDAGSFVLPGDVELSGDEVLYEAIFIAIDEYYIDIFGVQQENIKELLENEALNNFVFTIAEGGVDYVLGITGGDTLIVPVNQIIELIEENTEKIEAITGYALVESDLHDIERILTGSIINDLTWDNAMGGTVSEIDALRSAFSLFERYSTIMLAAISALALTLTILLVILNRRRVYGTLMYFFIPCIVSGAAVIIGSFLTAVLLRWISGELSLNNAVITAVNEAFAAGRNAILYCGLVVFAAGVVGTVTGVVIGKIKIKSI